MTKERYESAVRSVGNNTQVARLLGVERETVSRRIHGHLELPKEAQYAIRFLRQYYHPRPTVPKALKDTNCVFL